MKMKMKWELIRRLISLQSPTRRRASVLHECGGRRSASRSSMEIDSSRMISRGLAWVRFDDAGVILCLHCGLDPAVETRASGSVSNRGGDAISYFVEQPARWRAESSECFDPDRAEEDAARKRCILRLFPDLGCSGSGSWFDGGHLYTAGGACVNNCWVPGHGEAVVVREYRSPVRSFAITRVMPGGSRTDTIPASARANGINLIYQN